MGDPLEPNFLKGETVEKDSKISIISKITEIHPLAFTIEFEDQNFDENKKSKVQQRLRAFTFKHKANSSLPDFREVKNANNCAPVEKAVSPVNIKHVPVLHKKLEKSNKNVETQWKSTALKAAQNIELRAPFSFRANAGKKDNFIKSLKVARRYSLDGVDDFKTNCQNISSGNANNSIVENNPASKSDDVENKSDTISEAGTYTVDKEEEVETDADRTQVLLGKECQENREYLNGAEKDYHNNWINEWVKDVEEQNLLNPVPKEPPTISRNLGNVNSSCETSKIPSPFNTLSSKAKPRTMKLGNSVKLNGSVFHRRSSSLSAKDYTENQGSESSLETESFLKATQSVMTSMQNRIKLSLEQSKDSRRTEDRNFNYKERPHPPSTASDTDTNSDTDAKTFKKPIGNPFTSARLNRAFSLRRAKADPRKDMATTKLLTNNNNINNNNNNRNNNNNNNNNIGNEGCLNVKQGLTSKVMVSKPPSSTPFSRLDCGRFSMRSTMCGIRPNLANQAQKREIKKSNGGNRSTSSLSSREVEFQNWRRRKSFDPMKAAAEGRKKELAKKAAMNHSLTQSVNLGEGTQTRSSGRNPVLRSASFHSTAQALGNEEFQDQGSTDELEDSGSLPYISSRHSGSHNTPSQFCTQGKPALRTPVFSSRSSLISETHSSPCRRLRSNDLENLVLSAVSEASYKLVLKSCELLKKLNYLYETGEEKSSRLKDEIAILESGQNSTRNSPVHQATSKDLSVILKNLKGVENVFNVLENVLFDENFEIHINE